MGKGMRIVRGGITAALLAIAGGSALADEPNASGMRVIDPIFSQLVVWQMPAGFHGADEQTHGTHYIVEAVPTGQTVDHWSQMVTVTGLSGAAADPSLTPKILAQTLASNFRNTCPDTYDGAFLDAPKVDGFETFAALISCGSVPDPDEPRSESALVVVIKGARDYYTVQWAERSGPQAGAIAPDGSRWYARLHALMPIHLCDKVPGEAAPYPSCQASISGAAAAPSAGSATAGDVTAGAMFTEERSAAAGFVGGLHYFVGRMASACRPILHEPAGHPAELVANWKQQARNDRFYRTTVAYLARFLDWMEPLKGEQAARSELDRLIAGMQRGSNEEVQRELSGDDAANAAACRRFEEKVADGQFNVTPATPHYATLVRMATELVPDR